MQFAQVKLVYNIIQYTYVTVPTDIRDRYTLASFFLGREILYESKKQSPDQVK